MAVFSPYIGAPCASSCSSRLAKEPSRSGVAATAAVLPGTVPETFPIMAVVCRRNRGEESRSPSPCEGWEELNICSRYYASGASDHQGRFLSFVGAKCEYTRVRYYAVSRVLLVLILRTNKKGKRKKKRATPTSPLTESEYSEYSGLRTPTELEYSPTPNPDDGIGTRIFGGLRTPAKDAAFWYEFCLIPSRKAREDG